MHPQLRELADVDLTEKIIAAFYAVFTALGYGFPESVYRRALAFELMRRGLEVEEEVPVDVFYEGVTVGHFRANIVVEERIVLELKAKKVVAETDRHQLLNCLRASRLELGRLLHFGPKPRVRRVIYENTRKT